MAVKGNNMIPFAHFHKDWQGHIRTWFTQPGRKNRRRMKRVRKALRLAPRPVRLLQPVVHCPTVRYHTKLRIGRGFTLDELRRAGLSSKFAKTIGIAVDYRRRSKSVEILLTNVQRLKEYMTKLILFPTRKAKKLKKGEAPEEVRKLATQAGTTIPLRKTFIKMKSRVVTETDKNFCSYSALRMARAEVRLVGIRMKRLKEPLVGDVSITVQPKMKNKRHRNVDLLG